MTAGRAGARKPAPRGLLALCLAIIVLSAPPARGDGDLLSSRVDRARALLAQLQDPGSAVDPGHLEREARRWLRALVADGAPRFRDWQGAGEVFAPGSAADAGAFPGLPPATPADGHGGAAGTPGGPLIHFLHYNAEAAHYVRQLLARLRQGAAGPGGGVALPAPPRDAMIAMTAWWPLAADRPTPLPLWDPAGPLRDAGANGYLNWPAVGMVAAAGDAAGGPAAAGRFAGRPVSRSEPIPRAAFYRVRPAAEQGERLMGHPAFRTAAIIALGRPLAAGDELALVAFHLVHLGLEEGAWLTWWWDQRLLAAPRSIAVPGGGLAAAAAPAGPEADVPSPWSHYRGNMTLDPVYPREPDGGPHICFNPWFDAVFTDAGEGNGLRANCLSCHLRAGIPARGRLQVTRGRPAPLGDDITGTRLLWSLANPRRLRATGAGEEGH